MEIKKRIKGITLISLVITIIVLLILAGISINMLTGNNGLLTKTKEAVEKNEYGRAEEKVKLAVMEYYANMKEKTMYNILINIEGFEGISPDDENAGMPYDVTVDGYIFTVKENEETKDIEVEYKGKSNGIKPEIISTSSTKISDKEAKIEVIVKTEDEAGIEKIILLKNGLKVDEKQVEGTSITENFQVKENGEYTVIVVGKNTITAKSEKLEISDLISLSGTLNSGTIENASVILTVTGESVDSNISKVEIYEEQTKLVEIPIEEETKIIKKQYKIENLPFYEEKNYTAKITTKKPETITTNIKKVKNISFIATSQDLRKLSEEVNNGNEFQNSSIKLIKDIDLEGIEFTAIGKIWPINKDTPFKGTFDGNYHTITRMNAVRRRAIWIYIWWNIKKSFYY